MDSSGGKPKGKFQLVIDESTGFVLIDPHGEMSKEVLRKMGLRFTLEAQSMSSEVLRDLIENRTDREVLEKFLSMAEPPPMDEEKGGSC